MACGERFAFLLPPPCGTVVFGLCSGEDYELGRERTAEIRRRLIRVWNELIRIEDRDAHDPEKQGSYPVTERYRAEHDAWLAREEDLGWQLIASKSDFDAMYSVAQDGVCLLDQMVADGEAAYPAEVTVPEEPYTPPSKWDQVADVGRSAVTLAVVAVLGFVAFKVWDRYG